MRKGWLISGVVLAVLIGGGWGVKQYVAVKIGNEVVKLSQDEDVKKAIDDALAKNGGQDSVTNLLKNSDNRVASSQNPDAAKQASSSPVPVSQEQLVAKQDVTENKEVPQQKVEDRSPPTTPTPSIHNRDDAIQYAMSRFSAAEMARYFNDYRNKASLTIEQKNAIKAEILSRFTAAELKTLQSAAQK